MQKLWEMERNGKWREERNKSKMSFSEITSAGAFIQTQEHLHYLKEANLFSNLSICFGGSWIHDTFCSIDLKYKKK